MAHRHQGGQETIMGMIHGKPLSEAHKHEPRVPTRVVVKLAAGAPGPGDLQRALADLRQTSPGAEFHPYFAAGAEAAHARAAARAPFDRYLAAEAADPQSAAELAGRLRRLAFVEAAYVEGRPCPPPVNAADDPRSASQGYLDAAPAGIDARWAWAHADGGGVRVVDLEQGWTLNHEDLAAASISLISGLNHAFPGHGTAVLGQLVGVDNTRGVVGIAPRATARVVSQWRSSTNYNTADAILSAVDAMGEGDVLLLEANVDFNGYSLLPVEIEPAVFDAIRHAVDAGIVVVEAAGNGGNDLDTVLDSDNRQVFNRSGADFRDSGAIIVGASASTAPHGRLGFSNHGSRIDCYAWGQNIVTTGDGLNGTSTTQYTTGFGGTSGASPMVAGAAVLLQSWRKRRLGRTYAPESMRDMLASPALNTASANPAADRIGVMPDLRRIIEQELANDRYRYHHDKYLSFVYVLFGLLNDAPGLIWVPGKGPVPVDPGWGNRQRVDIASPQRDLLTALLMHELAGQVDDAATRAGLTSASVDGMRQAVQRIGRLQ
jgi:hypothetical protein